MKIVMITHGKVNPDGHNGISRVVFNMNKYEKLLGVESEIWSVVDGIKTVTEVKRRDGVVVKCFPRVSVLRGMNSLICKEILKNGNDVDMFHFHMPWLMDKLAISKAIRKINKPYIVTGHSAYSKNQKKSLKKTLGKIYELPFLNKAAAVHAITVEEMTEFRNYGINTKMFVVPNAVDIPEELHNCKRNELDNKYEDGKYHILFMGELRKQKNLEELVLAVTKLDEKYREEIVFDIVGPDSNGEMERLKSLADKKNVSESFIFHGGVFGNSREEFFKKANFYITPSRSEVISLSAIEATGYGLPGVFTRQSEVAYYYNRGFFIMCEKDSQDLARALREMLECKSEWNAMGEKAYDTYKECFSWKGNVSKLVEEIECVISQIK